MHRISVLSKLQRFFQPFEEYELKIKWGYPLRSIYNEFKLKVKNWLALINIYLLIDAIEVGGGTEESLETLAGFSESSNNLEQEKKAALMPLTIVPYIGAAMLTGTTVMFLQFFGSMQGFSIASAMIYRTLMTPLVLHCFLLGIVTGKLVSGRASAGFKHSILMVLVALGGMWIMSNFHFSLGFGG